MLLLEEQNIGSALVFVGHRAKNTSGPGEPNSGIITPYQGAKDRKLLRINNRPDLCLNPTQHRLGHGMSRTPCQRCPRGTNYTKLRLSGDRYLT